MSVLPTPLARQHTFTIDSTRVHVASEASPTSGTNTAEDEKSSHSTQVLTTDLFPDRQVSREIAARKTRLASTNSRINGHNKTQIVTALHTTTANTDPSDGSPNIPIAAQLSSSVKKRLRTSDRRQAGVSEPNSGRENTGEKVLDKSLHGESGSNGNTNPRAVPNHSTGSAPNKLLADTSTLRKIVSFNTSPQNGAQKSSKQFAEGGAAHTSVINPGGSLRDVDINPENIHQMTTSKYHYVKTKSGDESWALLGHTAESQSQQRSGHLQTGQVSLQTKDTSLRNIDPSPNQALAARLSRTVKRQNDENTTLAKQIKDTQVDQVNTEHDLATSDRHKLNGSVYSIPQGNTPLNQHLKVLQSVHVLKNVNGNSRVTPGLSQSGRTAHSSTTFSGSSEDLHSGTSNQENICVPVVESASGVVSSGAQVSPLIDQEHCNETGQTTDNPVDNAPSPAQVSPLAIGFTTLLDKEFHGDSLIAHNQKHSVGIPRHSDLVNTQISGQRFSAESAEGTPGSRVVQTAGSNVAMARPGPFRHVKESFDDVLKERNDMEKSERVYRKRIRQLEEELKQMVQQCQVLSGENKELRKTVDGIKTNHNSDNLETIARLETDKSKLVTKYNEQLKQMEFVRLDNSKIKSLNIELESKVSDLEKQVSSLSTKLTSREKDKRDLNAKIHELQNTIRDLEHEKKAVEAKVKSLEYDNKSLTDSAESTRQEINELSKQVQTRSLTEENLMRENHHLKQELAQIKKKYGDLEVSTPKLQDLLAEQNHKLDKANTDNEEKNKIIANLKQDLKANIQEMKKLNESQQASRDKEKDLLMSRIGSLKAEIDSSLLENHKLKQDREEMVQIISKLRQDNMDATEASKDSKMYQRKWEQEKEHRSRVEYDLDKKKEEVLLLENRLKDAENKINTLHKASMSLQDEQSRMYQVNEPETDTRVLMEQNMKLRQMLVERNIQLTNTKHEQTVTDSRIQHLERQQKQSQAKVQLLSEYLETMTPIPDTDSNLQATPASPKASDKRSQQPQPYRRNNGSPQNSQSRQSQAQRRKPEPPQNLHKNVGSSTKGLQEIARSGREKTTSSLPVLDTTSSPCPPARAGYMTLYREKQKLVHSMGYR